MFLINFSWLVYDAISIKPIARAVTSNFYEKLDLDKTDAFTKQEVQKYIGDSVYETINALPSFIFPSIGMLIGGLFLMYSKENITDVIKK